MHYRGNTMEQIEGKNYLTILEVMERLNVCRQTVLRYRLSKKLDFIRLRGKIYITEESYNNMFIPESEKSTQNQKNQTAPYDREQVEETLKILLHIAQSIAIMRAIASNKVKNTQAFWLPIQGNCYDLAVIEWCKVFPPNTGYLHFKSIMPNDKDKKFEAELCKFLDIDKDKYNSYVKELKTYRDKLISHTDKNWRDHIPELPYLEIALRSTFFFYKYFLSYYKKDHNSEAGINFFGHGINDLEDYYNKYNKQVLEIIEKAIESTKDIDDLCL